MQRFMNKNHPLLQFYVNKVENKSFTSINVSVIYRQTMM